MENVKNNKKLLSALLSLVCSLETPRMAIRKMFYIGVFLLAFTVLILIISQALSLLNVVENFDYQGSLERTVRSKLGAQGMLQSNLVEQLYVSEFEIATRWRALEKEVEDAKRSSLKLSSSSLERRGLSAPHLAKMEAEYAARLEYSKWLESYIDGHPAKLQQVKLGELLASRALMEAKVLLVELGRGISTAEEEVSFKKNTLLNLDVEILITSSPLGLKYRCTDAYGRVIEGKTPKKVSIPIGRTELIIEPHGRGWPDFRREFYARVGEQPESCAVFSAAPVQIRSDPAGLAYEISNNNGYIKRGSTPAYISDIPEGLVKLKVTKDGWPDSVGKHTIKAGQTNELSATFKLGNLTVVSNPSSADVYIDRLKVGQTPLSINGLYPEKQLVELKLKGYEDFTTNHVLEAGTTTSLYVNLNATILPVVGRPHTIPGLDLEMAPIEPGSFLMGSIPGGCAGEGESAERGEWVTLTKAFWLGRTEVTQAQWTTLMGDNPSFTKGAQLPVEYVSYNDALEFCRILTVRERLKGRLPKGYCYTLPTEAQWEYACSAIARGVPDISSTEAGQLADTAWYNINSGLKLHEVATRTANALGLHDKLGNVWEWCLDWKGEYLGGADPEGPVSGELRVIRGGSCNSNGNSCCKFTRQARTEGYTGRNLGFRIALVAGR